MKLRHVRAVAVFTLVVVALTGARRGGGGGCDDDHDSSGSSGGSGGVDVVETTIPPLPTETETEGAPAPGAPKSSAPAKSKGKVTSVKGEVKIVGCVVEKTGDGMGTITFEYEVSNGNSAMAANYEGTLLAVDPDGTLRANSFLIQHQIEPGTTWPGEVKGSYVVGPGQKVPSSKSCKVGDVNKTNVASRG